MECHCVLIHDLNALPPWPRQDVAEIGIGVCKLKICLDCLCIERRPIVERDALFQMEGQSSSVIPENSQLSARRGTTSPFS